MDYPTVIGIIRIMEIPSNTHISLMIMIGDLMIMERGNQERGINLLKVLCCLERGPQVMNTLLNFRICLPLAPQRAIIL